MNRLGRYEGWARLILLLVVVPCVAYCFAFARTRTLWKEVRQPRLCVAHDLRRFGKAAEVDGGYQNFKFFAVHIPTPIKGILICNIPIITERFSFSSAGCNIFNTKELIIP